MYHSLKLIVTSYMLAAALAGCASVPRTGPSALPPASHRVAQVAAVAKRSEIVGTPVYQLMLDGGIKDAQIVDGSEGAGIVYCCGLQHSLDTSIVFFVPPHLKLQPGDVVEIKDGGEPNGSGYGTVNIALIVREQAKDFPKTCRWVPPDGHEGTSLQLWGRVLYCDWMPHEGWMEEKSLTVHSWYRSL